MKINAWLLLTTVLLAGCVSAPAPEDQAIEAPESVAIQPGARADRQSQHCMALAMYWEARGEGVSGMQAVGSVILNRVADPRFPGSPCDVVQQGGEIPPCQFSWWCDGKSDRPTSPAQWQKALTLADQLLTAPHRDLTDGALFFHSTAIDKPWRRQQTAQIGNHIFYR